MANNNWPHGFKPLMVDLAGAPVGVNQYAKPASDTNAIYTWDLLRRITGSATVQGQAIPTPNCQTYATGTVGASGTLILGSSLDFGAASTASLHIVVDDVNALFEAQCGSTTSISVATHSGANANADNSAQTNGTTLSAMQVLSSSFATTANLDLRIRDLSRNVNNAEGPNAIVEVLIMRHFYAQGSTGL